MMSGASWSFSATRAISPHEHNRHASLVAPLFFVNQAPRPGGKARPYNSPGSASRTARRRTRGTAETRRSRKRPLRAAAEVVRVALFAFFASFPTTARARFCAHRTRAFERKKQIKEGGGAHSTQQRRPPRRPTPTGAGQKENNAASRLTTHRDVTPLTEATATRQTVIGFCARAAPVRQLLSTRDHRAMELRASRQIPETRAHVAARAHTCVWRTDGLLSRVVTAGRVASAAGAVLKRLWRSCRFLQTSRGLTCHSA
jgi:hypothetical protein